MKMRVVFPKSVPVDITFLLISLGNGSISRLFNFNRRTLMVQCRSPEDVVI